MRSDGLLQPRSLPSRHLDWTPPTCTFLLMVPLRFGFHYLGSGCLHRFARHTFWVHRCPHRACRRSAFTLLQPCQFRVNWRLCHSPLLYRYIPRVLQLWFNSGLVLDGLLARQFALTFLPCYLLRRSVTMTPSGLTTLHTLPFTP